MSNAFRYLCFTLAALVIVQVAAISYWAFARSSWVFEGNSLTKSAILSGKAPGGGGYEVHEMVGNWVIPVVTVAILAVAVIGEIPRAVKVASILVGAIIVQLGLAQVGGKVPFLGMLHGVLAVVILVGALHAARLARPAANNS